MICRFARRAALRVAAAAGMSTAVVASSVAQDAPNLVGTWKGSALAVYIGTTPYRPADRPAPAFPADTVEFTYTISEQKDNRFVGKSTDGTRTETLIGAISSNNQGGIILDDDGQYLFTIRDRNTLDTCYGHLKPGSTVVTCFAWKRVN